MIDTIYNMQDSNCVKCNKFLENKRNKFCSRSCAASYNNVKFPKRTVEDPQLWICNCGNKKDYRSSKCRPCKAKQTIEMQKNKKIKDYLLKGNARVKYASIRDLARNFMEFFKIKKECFVCGFDVCVEVAHLRSISSFPEESLIRRS